MGYAKYNRSNPFTGNTAAGGTARINTSAGRTAGISTSPGRTAGINTSSGSYRAGERGNTANSLSSYFPESRDDEAKPSSDPNRADTVRVPRSASETSHAETENTGFTLSLDSNSLINGIILSEILGKPKSKMKGRW